MNRFKQVSTAIVFVTSLGLVMPSSLGGSASADIKPPPNDHVRNPQYVETIFNCDLDGDGDYETEYELVSTFGAKMWQDKSSNTIVVQRLRVDVVDSYYTVFNDPTGTAVNFSDPDVYWFDGPVDYEHKPKGWKTVRCTEEVSYPYAPNKDDVDLGIGFVQTGECLEDPSDQNEDCVIYTETDTNLYDVTISPEGGAVKAASADGGGNHHKKANHKGKRGNHKGKKGKNGH